MVQSKSKLTKQDFIDTAEGWMTYGHGLDYNYLANSVIQSHRIEINIGMTLEHIGFLSLLIAYSGIYKNDH